MLYKHWVDLRILDKDVLALQERLFDDTEKQPIDLTKRTLYVSLLTTHLKKVEGFIEVGGRMFQVNTDLI